MEVPTEMQAVVLRRHGGPDAQDYTTVPVPQLRGDEVLIKVAACSLNQTDVNTRVGWYGQAADALEGSGSDFAGKAASKEPIGGWGSKAEDIQLRFPRIQGADVVGSVLHHLDEEEDWMDADGCFEGHIVKVGEDVNASRIGERVLVFAWISDPKNPTAEMKYVGSETDGGFAEYCAVPSRNVYSLTECGLSDVELAAVPCAYGTAENLLTKTRVSKGDVVLIRGASGGVGSALIQLCRYRGAETIAVVGAGKREAALEVGATWAYERGPDLLANLSAHAISVCIDVVGGPEFRIGLKALATHGRYASSGAIGGPAVSFDLRDLIYKDLEMHGATRMKASVFEQLVHVLETSDALKPRITATYPLRQLDEAQEFFLQKTHVGKVVITISDA